MPCAAAMMEVCSQMFPSIAYACSEAMIDCQEEITASPSLSNFETDHGRKL